MTADHLAKIAELLHACPEPGVADGMDLCPCGTGETWPCKVTQAAWLAQGKDRNAEVRRVLDRATRAAGLQADIEREMYEELRATRGEAYASNWIARQAGW